MQIETATDNTVVADLVVLPTFSLGPVEVKNHVAVVVASNQLEQRLLGINWYRFDGIIGWPLIKKLDLTIDFAQQTLEIQRPETTDKVQGNLVWLFDDPMVITRDRQDSQLWFLDTGAMESQLTSNSLSHNERADIEWRQRKFNGLGGKGSSEKVGEFGPVQLHFPSLTRRFKKLTVRAGHQDCTHSRCDGRIGVDSADKLRMHINFSAASFDIDRID